MNAYVRNAKLIMSALVLSFIPLASFAGEAEQEGAEHSFEQHGRHSLGPFIGITREHGHNRETIGIEYSYRITKYWSAGAVVERAERGPLGGLNTVQGPRQQLWSIRPGQIYLMSRLLFSLCLSHQRLRQC